MRLIFSPVKRDVPTVRDTSFSSVGSCICLSVCRILASLPPHCVNGTSCRMNFQWQFQQVWPQFPSSHVCFGGEPHCQFCTTVLRHGAAVQLWGFWLLGNVEIALSIRLSLSFTKWDQDTITFPQGGRRIILHLAPHACTRRSILFRSHEDILRGGRLARLWTKPWHAQCKPFPLSIFQSPPSHFVRSAISLWTD